MPVNRWKHIATTWDGKVQRVYVDGKLTRTSKVAARAHTSSGQLRIGGATFKGAIDDVRVYNRALGVAEIKADAAFASFPLVRMSRLSVMPVTDAEWARVEKMSRT